MTEKQNAFIKLHLSVLLAGFTGLFGKLITLNEVNIVWYRMFFASVFLLLLKGLPKVTSRKLLHLSLAGALLGFHWVLFYSSIKLSNISIGVICYSLVGFFTALIEPAVFHKRVSFLEILFSLITVLGLLCIFSFDSRYRLGISILVCCSPVRHAEQENFGRCVEQHNTPLLDDGRSGFPFVYHSTLFIGLPLLTACDRIPAGEQSVLASLSVARLYRRVIPLADTITQAPICLYSELDL